MTKNIVISGSNRGLGNGINEVFKENGYNTIGLNKTHIDNPTYQEIITDITNLNSLNEILHLIPNEVDVLVINAAIRRFANIEQMTSKDWEESVNINLTGAFNVIKTILPFVKKAKGDIIIIGSHSEKYTFEEGSAYCSTKLALRGMSECLMEEVRYDDVRVSYLSLGAIMNREHGYDESWKLLPKEVGETILSLVKLPKKVEIPYLDVRPLKPLKSPLSGIERLQYV